MLGLAPNRCVIGGDRVGVWGLSGKFQVRRAPGLREG